MSNDNPFLLFKVECPICKTVNEFELVRVGAYVEEGRDSDFAPLNIKWRNPRYQAFHPLTYFTATCANCYYTREFTNEFKDWKNDGNFRTYKLKSVKEKHLELLSNENSIIKRIGSQIDPVRYPNESAALKLLIAIFDEMLYEFPSQLDIGRFYLRIGWIMRDMNRGENPHVVMLRALIGEINSKYTSLKQSIERTNAEIRSFTKIVDNQFNINQLPVELKSKILGFRDRFQSECESFQHIAVNGNNSIEQLHKTIEEYKQNLLGTSGSGRGMTFGSHSSFGEFLTLVKDVWENAVTDEREALEFAVHHYKRAFAEGKDIAPGNQQIQASYLIAELSRRIGNYDEAKQYFTSTIKSGQEFIYQHRNDQSRTALARKILELAIEQGRSNLTASKPV